MSHDIYSNVINVEMSSDREEKAVDIYESADCIKDLDFRTDTNTQQPLQHTEKCIYYKSSFYYLSTGKKNWNESRQDCLQRRADLIIINDRKEQDFVMNIADKREFWIGVTDIVEEGTWKWADGSTLTSGFWATNGKTPEPNGKRDENCAVTCLRNHPQLIGWIDVTCNGDYQWICEKSI
ncbi:C-type lectin domain family 4 member F-like protein [Labeo rohita]|uniref:C-type lectin domain family 4 member F-like protein n=1 Tax=Labeo rohita TaxID=84645 RepID=A0A498NYD3_LABRO|nr:C-type lectin domain family 4 member F-like protein [Labeo rohita]